jgi:PIN domain nuclease of toxin-antitoxin system
MRVLVDTHAFFWWITDDKKLSSYARDLLAAEENQVIVSAVVAWEMASKVRFFKWPEAIDLALNVERLVEANRFTPLAITITHARTAGFLPGHHRDPFDRMLAAQSQVEGIALVTADPVFVQLGVQVLW